MTIDITPKSGAWTATFDESLPSGLKAISANGIPFLTNFINAIGQLPLRQIRTHNYRKGGVAVCETESRIGGVKDGTGIHQTIRLANNIARVTVDMMIKKDTFPNGDVQLGSLTLPGPWSRLCIISQDGNQSWQDLASGFNLSFTPENLPLALIAENSDGFRVELSTGFDIWRWNFGLESKDQIWKITVDETGLHLNRTILLAQPPVDDAPVAIPPRDYRFCYSIAWGSNRLVPEFANAQKLNLAEGNIKGQIAPDAQAFILDLKELSVPSNARKNAVQNVLPCWESNDTVNAAKTVIRKLANACNGGKLLITGCEPAMCTTGRHVNRPKGTIKHWDLNGIQCFAIWAKQCLGESWDIQYGGSSAWRDALPTLQYLFGDNGFSN